MVPMNLMNKNHKADYVITGQWAKKAAKEAARYVALPIRSSRIITIVRPAGARFF